MRYEKRSIAIDVWIAEDGEEFDVEEKCMDYEKNHMNEMIAQRLPHFSYTPDYVYYEYDYIWYKISSKEELNAVREYLYCPDASAWCYDGPQEYPCWLAFAVEDEDAGYGYVVGTEEDIFKYCLEFLKSVANKREKFCDERENLK